MCMCTFDTMPRIEKMSIFGCYKVYIYMYIEISDIVFAVKSLNALVFRGLWSFSTKSSDEKGIDAKNQQQKQQQHKRNRITETEICYDYHHRRRQRNRNRTKKNKANGFEFTVLGACLLVLWMSSKCMLTLFFAVNSKKCGREIISKIQPCDEHKHIKCNTHAPKLMHDGTHVKPIAYSILREHSIWYTISELMHNVEHRKWLCAPNKKKMDGRIQRVSRLFFVFVCWNINILNDMKLSEKFCWFRTHDTNTLNVCANNIECFLL